MATKMDEHPFTMKECERALDDLIAKEEEDDDDDDDEDDEKKKKKKKKKKEESTPRTLKERKDGWLEKKKKFVKWHKRYEKKNGEEPVAFSELRIHDCREEVEESGGRIVSHRGGGIDEPGVHIAKKKGQIGERVNFEARANCKKQLLGTQRGR